MSKWCVFLWPVLALIKAYLLISRLQVDNTNFAKICEMIIQIIQDDGPTLAKDSSVHVDGFPAKREATASHTSNTGTSIMVTRKKLRDTVLSKTEICVYPNVTTTNSKF